jgi:hypothetical protein
MTFGILDWLPALDWSGIPAGGLGTLVRWSFRSPPAEMVIGAGLGAEGA